VQTVVVFCWGFMITLGINVPAADEQGERWLLTLLV
jgi:hypothetical protein